VATLGRTYPEIVAARTLAVQMIAQEEVGFRSTLRAGETRLAAALDDLVARRADTVPGELAFELYDTYGFPVELTEEIAAERGISVDRTGFDTEMAAQRKRSRTSGTRARDASEEPLSALDVPDTRFVGYDRLEHEAEILGADLDGEGRYRLVFDATPFYATGGGQVADTGIVENLSRKGTGTVIDVQRVGRDVSVHRVKRVAGGFEIGDCCRLQVDRPRRRQIERNHTATHLLHEALHRVLGEHAIQAGSQVAPEELRFDFTHFEPMRPEELTAVEDLVNGVVLGDEPVLVEEQPTDVAIASGAAAHFTEEYRDKPTVRVVSVDAFSKELCGGTHVRRSGEIGLLRILAEEGIASGTRRIRAITGEAVLQRIRGEEQLLGTLRARLGDEPLAVLDRLDEELRALRAAARELDDRRAQATAGDLAARAQRHGAVHVLIERVDGLTTEAAKTLCDRLVDELSPAVVFVAAVTDGRVLLVGKRSPSIEAIHVGTLVRNASTRLGGGGGGSPQFAQGGGGGVDAVEDALGELRARVDASLEADND
jgi:alanyl-tRNA synthetase